MIKFMEKLKSFITTDRDERSRVEGMKYFCIGLNKTGTTSLKKAFEDLDFVVGDQMAAEKLADRYYFDGNFEPIISYCETAQVFQDIPFSWPETFKHLDQAFPDSKFILTVRDTPEQWYQSLVRFHSKSFGSQGGIPTAEELRNVAYVNKGFVYRAVKVYGTLDDDLYNKDALIAHYDQYNKSVLEYFRDRPDDLLVINLSEQDAYGRYCAFLGVEPLRDAFPWENKT